MKKLLLILIFILTTLNLYAQTYPPKYTNHNKIKDCKNLLQKYSLDQLSAMIASGNFDDIYVGDYIEMEMTSDYGTEKVRWLVAAIDYFRYRTDVDLLDHHIVLVAENCFKTYHRMNISDTTSGGFAGSEMYTSILPNYDTAITNAFGSSHVLSYHQLLTTSMSSTIPSMRGNNTSGASNNWAWANGSGSNPHVTKLNLMNEPQLIKSCVQSSSFYDIGINNSQFPLFAQLPEKIRCGRGFNNSNDTRYPIWLSNVASSINFGRFSGLGYLDSSYASNSGGVRPYFLFK